MSPKIDKKVGIHFNKNVLSEINLPLRDRVRTNKLPR